MACWGEDMKFTTKIIYYVLIVIPLYFIFKSDFDTTNLKLFGYSTLLFLLILPIIHIVKKKVKIIHYILGYLICFSILLIVINVQYSPITNLLNSTENYENATSSKNHTKTDLSSELVWYDSEKAIKHHLQPKYLNEISNYVAHTLKGDSIQDTAWNIVEWEDKTIQYDYTKAKYSGNYSYALEGNNVVSINATKYDKIQTPQQTIERKKGVCIDYAILTAALLLKNGYQPVYIFETDDHAFAAIKINGKFYAIDQHPPIENVDKHLYNLNNEHSISKVYYYKIWIQNNKTDVSKYEYKWSQYMSLSPMEERDDIRSIILNEILKAYPNLHMDSNINNLDNNRYLPEGYSKGTTLVYSWNITIDNAFKQQYGKWIARTIMDDSSKYFQEYNCIYANAMQNGNIFTVKIYLAKR